MEPNTDKQIEEQFKTLPVALQRAITLTPWRNLLQEVARNNNLDTEKSKDLETETMLVMYGFESQDDFAKNIIRELGLEPGRAGMIAKDVDDKVFALVLDKANNLEKETGEETLQSAYEKAVETPTPPPVPNKPSINLIPPAEPEKKPLDLLPSNLPTIVGKPKELEVVRNVPRAYPDGIDPYREPIK